MLNGGQGGRQFFTKLLQNDNLKKQRERQSQLLTADKAEELALKLEEKKDAVVEEDQNSESDGSNSDQPFGVAEDVKDKPESEEVVKATTPKDEQTTAPATTEE